MTSCRVIWDPAAEADLATAWIEADDQRAVTEAAGQVEAMLARDPSVRGTELHEGLRVIVIGPLRTSLKCA